ncbi:MAG: hypothetical protein NUV70_07160 [Caldiserica bacterium]|jgi:hypothetical protein|nr:hypothetical protein [Caldisericota bacterium]
MEENVIYPVEVKEGESSLRPLAQAPEIVLQEAQRAATALQRVVANKRKPVIFRGEQYLEFEDWQTVAKFYGLCTRSVEAVPVEIFGIKGAKAKAEVIDLRTGMVVGGAEAYCMRDEENWKEKPWFQLASMAQTRAGAKALRNVLAWVVVLAGYRPTPAEELPSSPQGKARVSAPQENGGSGTPANGAGSLNGGGASPSSGGSSPTSGAGSSPSGNGAPGSSPSAQGSSTGGSAPSFKGFPLSPQGNQLASPSGSSGGNGELSPTPSTERPTREEIQNLLRLAYRNGFQTVNAEGKKCVDYHHLGEFLKSNGFPPMIREMTREQCYLATLCLESRAKTLFLKGE